MTGKPGAGVPKLIFSRVVVFGFVGVAVFNLAVWVCDPVVVVVALIENLVDSQVIAGIDSRRGKRKRA